MFRIQLILVVFLALACTGLAAAADSPTAPLVSQRPDGRLLPGSADIPRAGVLMPGASETSAVTSRPDGRILPDAADLRTGEAPPIVIRVDRVTTASFDWLDALIGGLVVAGVVLAVGGLVVARRRSPTLAR